jgi:hypothetical protein
VNSHIFEITRRTFTMTKYLHTAILAGGLALATPAIAADLSPADLALVKFGSCLITKAPNFAAVQLSDDNAAMALRIAGCGDELWQVSVFCSVNPACSSTQAVEAINAASLQAIRDARKFANR